MNRSCLKKPSMCPWVVSRMAGRAERRGGGSCEGAAAGGGCCAPRLPISVIGEELEACAFFELIMRNAMLKSNSAHRSLTCTGLPRS